MNIDFNSVETPCYIVDEKLLRKNLEILKYVQDKTGAKILLATKAFSMFSTFNIFFKITTPFSFNYVNYTLFFSSFI